MGYTTPTMRSKLMMAMLKALTSLTSACAKSFSHSSTLKSLELKNNNSTLCSPGDDFRYNYGSEWDQQYASYSRLAEHINADPNYHAHVSFGTLKDYFAEVNTTIKWI